MRRDSPGSFSGATRSLRLNGPNSNVTRRMAKPIPAQLMTMNNAGGCDFTAEKAATIADAPKWAAWSTPTVTAVTDLPICLSNSAFQLSTEQLASQKRLLETPGSVPRVETLTYTDGPVAVLIPLDRLFDVRLAAALQLWRQVIDPTARLSNPARLSKTRTARLILALRALDARRERASYRDIANALFAAHSISAAAWKTHDLRDRTIRLVRSGVRLMEGGYRQLLVHPYRGRR